MPSECRAQHVEGNPWSCLPFFEIRASSARLWWDTGIAAPGQGGQFGNDPASRLLSARCRAWHARDASCNASSAGLRPYTVRILPNRAFFAVQGAVSHGECARAAWRARLRPRFLPAASRVTRSADSSCGPRFRRSAPADASRPVNRRQSTVPAPPVREYRHRNGADLVAGFGIDPVQLVEFVAKIVLELVGGGFQGSQAPGVMDAVQFGREPGFRLVRSVTS